MLRDGITRGAKLADIHHLLHGTAGHSRHQEVFNEGFLRVVSSRGIHPRQNVQRHVSQLGADAAVPEEGVRRVVPPNEEEPSLIVDAIAAGASHSLVAAHYAF